LTGRIPAQLGDLKKLKELRLRENRLCGPVPSNLENLKLDTYTDYAIDPGLSLWRNHLDMAETLKNADDGFKQFLGFPADPSYQSRYNSWYDSEVNVYQTPSPVGCPLTIPQMECDPTREICQACIVGTGEGKSFSWLLKDSTGTTVVGENNNVGTTITRLGKTANQITASFASEMELETGDAPNCIKLGVSANSSYKLFVGPAGGPANCEVNATGCQFNPTIKLVSKQQLLTSIRGFLWNDLNSNGLQETNEAYLQGWTVVLKYPNGLETSTVSTGDGYYEFTGLSTVGDYAVTVETRTGATYVTAQSVTRTLGPVNVPKLASALTILRIRIE